MILATSIEGVGIWTGLFLRGRSHLCWVQTVAPLHHLRFYCNFSRTTDSL